MLVGANFYREIRRDCTDFCHAVVESLHMAAFKADAAAHFSLTPAIEGVKT